MGTGETQEYDVIVAGGGPGGATLATLLVMRGHRVLVLEKEQFPRYQIGESLLPSTVHGICRLTGASAALEKAGFTLKRGGTFQWGSSPDPWTFSFSVSPKMAGKTSFAYQVERSKFDQILLERARNAGAEVREECSVISVIEDSERVTGVRYTDAAGSPRQATARYVVDASGNKSRLYRAVGGTREYSEFFRNLALFGYYEGGKRMAAPDDGNILCSAFDDGWFWYIPLSPKLTSVGAVVRSEFAEKVQGDPELAIHDLIAKCPLISEYLKDATRVTEGQYGQLRVRKDYSYHNTKFWRPGMALIGDAACFVDPVFSSGVHLATYSALLVARSINSVLAGVLDEKTAFDEFEARYRREYGVFYEFLTSFYDMHSSEESYFWAARKVTQDSHSELEAFVSLVGGVSSGESVLAGASAVADRLKSRSAEFSKAVEALSGEDEQGSMVPLFRSSIVRQALKEGAQVQAQALLGEDAEPDFPLFPGGLIPSADAMSWAIPE